MSIFNKTFSLFLEHLEDYLFGCYDPLGLLIMIRIVCQNNVLMQSKRIICLDSFFDRINMLLWPRFKTVFDYNVESIQKIKPTLQSINASGLHYVTKRYAEFVCAILRLNQDYNDEILTSNLRRLRNEIEKLLIRSASTLNAPKKQVIFLINNYLHITKVLVSKNFNNADENVYFGDLANAQITLYVEQELEKFGRLISFVRETESLLEQKEKLTEEKYEEKKKELKIDLVAAESIVRHFAKYWKDNIEQIHSSVNKNFAPAGTDTSDESKGRETEILKQVLAQLMLYYTRFQDVLKKVCAGQSFMKELVPKQTIIYELRQYARSLE